jgi:hypothetical protein
MLKLYKLIVGSLLLVVMACKEENPKPVIIPPDSLIPVRLEQGNHVTELKYDNQNRLIQVDFTSSYSGGTMLSFQKFTYNSEGLVSSVVTDQDFRFLYFYQNRQLIKTEEYIGDHLTQTHEFTYDQNNRVAQSVAFQDIPDEGGVIPVSKTTYAYDSKGNLIQNKLYYYSTAGSNETLLTTLDFSGYDDKLNSEVYFELPVINPLHFAFKNNPTKVEVRNHKGILVSTEYYTYFYNPQGFASSKTTKVESLSGNETFETKYFFK